MIRPSTSEPIQFPALDASGELLTGVTDLYVTIVNPANGQVWDWSTSAFTATPVDPTEAMAAVNATYSPGLYSVTWPGTSAVGTYTAIITQTPGTTVSNVPASVELKVRQDSVPGDQMALTAGERTTVQALILSDATPFQGARVDAAISSRSSQASVDALPTASANATATWASGTRTLTGIGSSGIASQASVDALPTASAIGTAVWATVTPNAAWTYGTSLALLRKWITNKNQVDTTSNGRMRLFDDDETTVLLTWTLRDAAGNAITTPSGSPAQRGEAT